MNDQIEITKSGNFIGEQLFNLWCGRSYIWSACTKVERMRWNGMADAINSVTVELQLQLDVCKAAYRKQMEDHQNWGNSICAERATLKKELEKLKSINQMQSDRIKKLEDQLVGKPSTVN